MSEGWGAKSGVVSPRLSSVSSSVSSTLYLLMKHDPLKSVLGDLSCFHRLCVSARLNTLLLFNITASASKPVCPSVWMFFLSPSLSFSCHPASSNSSFLSPSSTFCCCHFYRWGQATTIRSNVISLFISIRVQWTILSSECVYCKNPVKLTAWDSTYKWCILFAANSINSSLGDV